MYVPPQSLKQQTTDEIQATQIFIFSCLLDDCPWMVFWFTSWLVGFVVSWLGMRPLIKVKVYAIQTQQLYTHVSQQVFSFVSLHWRLPKVGRNHQISQHETILQYLTTPKPYSRYNFDHVYCYLYSIKSCILLFCLLNITYSQLSSYFFPQWDWAWNQYCLLSATFSSMLFLFSSTQVIARIPVFSSCYFPKIIAAVYLRYILFL